ncbi:auxin-induced protein 22D-like [Abrus precatorius]|uniref:Auxin-induced protein n=1 Tax=Abrus precatorius TaxID=3816 RepID=A0A8B8MK92_ABRPR|nr:auxin-induced protein 22D-like [Abrus precatorius]
MSTKMENNSLSSHEQELNLKDTELRLGLPGSDEPDTRSVIRSNKRSSPEASDESISKSLMNSNGSDITNDDDDQDNVPPAKAQVVGWPPIRSFRKNTLQVQEKKGEEGEGSGMYVKVSMAGAPYLRKMDLKVYKSYPELLKAMENMFKCTFGEYSEREGYNGSEYAPTYEDKDGDWMLVGDVPWNMFVSSCKRLRIMKGSEAKGLGCF